MKNRFDADAGRPDEARFVGFFIESRTGNIQVDPRRAVVDELLEEEACRNRAGFGTRLPNFLPILQRAFHILHQPAAAISFRGLP